MFKPKPKIISQNKEFLTNLIVIAVCFWLFIFFPNSNVFQKLTSFLFFLFVIPTLYIKLILKKRVADFGLNIQHKKEGFIWGTLMLIVSLVLAYLLIHFTPFLSNYPIPALFVHYFWIFFLSLLTITSLLLFFQEYFFRGFVLFTFSKKTSFWSILIQATLYLSIVLFLQGNIKQNLWNLAPMIILSFTGGVTAYKSRSMVYSYASGLLFLIIFNSYLIHLIKIK